ncbi:MAG: tRNA 2-thiouridine(34) synthase MnmA [Candidatus Pacebacteria bacterium CG_4_10_14_0_8_um_filter_42_14]|nr:MAG: tRNA 2-thiouridine(34) synthase MnmA [Candidatus Pacebacteria bacterium CG_4_10_14_0_8_um_filter_42_14]
MKVRKKIALGMSGGVDSSLSAHLLVEGYDVTSVFLECWRAPSCHTDEDRADALKVALSLNIPFQVLDFKQTYRDSVVQAFFDDYKAGRTPNPDIACNKEIKFGLFYDWAMENGFDAIATGHYAKIIDGKLAIPADKHKDQTYFLYQVSEDQLKHVVFPLENITKPEVRAEAEKRSLHVKDKKDSVGICFIGDIDVHSFLKDELGENPGPVVDLSGNIIGKHNGLWFYTIGQRHGFEIDKRSLITTENGKIERQNFPPFYVVSKKQKENQLVVGFGTETEQSQFSVRDIHWISRSQPENLSNLLVRIRHTGELLPGNLQKNKVKLGEPIRGISPGQSAVFYQKQGEETICLGGAIIDEVVFDS